MRGWLGVVGMSMIDMDTIIMGTGVTRMITDTVTITTIMDMHTRTVMITDTHMDTITAVPITIIIERRIRISQE